MRTNRIYGAEKKIITIINMLSQDSPENRYILAVADTRPFKGLLNDNVELILLPAVERQENFLRRFFAYMSFFFRTKPDVIFFSQFKLSSFGIAELLPAKLSMTKKVVQILHSSPSPIEKYESRKWFGILPGLGLSWRLERISRFFLQFFSNCVLTVSSKISNDLVYYENWKSVPVKQLPYGIDTDKFKPELPVRQKIRRELNIPEDAIVLISTSRIDANKRVDWVIDVFKYVRDNSGKKVFLILLGNGPENYVKGILSKVKTYKLDPFVRYIGYTENVAFYLKASDIFLLLSRREGFGIGLLEAMACELLCICTKTEGPSEIIEDNINGVLVDNDLDDVRKNVLDIIRNFDHKTHMKQSARFRVVDKYDWQKVRGELKDVFLGKC